MAPWPGGATDYIKNKVTTKRKTHWLQQDPLIRTPPYGPCRMQLYSYRACGGSWQFGARHEPANNGTLACWKDALSGSVRVESYKHKKLCDKRKELTGELASTAVVRGFQGVTITTNRLYPNENLWSTSSATNLAGVSVPTDWLRYMRWYSRDFSWLELDEK